MKTLGGGRRLIGGDFESPGLGEARDDTLERLARGRFGTWCSSGRAALTLLLHHLKGEGIERVTLPAFLCASVIEAVQRAGLSFDFYPVRADLSGEPEPSPGTAVLIIHYFGWMNALHGQGFIEDYSMAPCSGHGAPEGPWFFSLRKIGATPLGGWSSVEAMLAPSDRAEYLCRKSLLARKAKYEYLKQSVEPVDEDMEAAYLDPLREVEEGFSQLEAEASLPGDALQAILALDLDDLSRVRTRNWHSLHGHIDGKVETLFPLVDGVIPLGYVIRVEQERRDALRAALAGDRIFCPAHWPLPAEVDPARYPDAAALAQSLVTLPIDQRYSDADMSYLAERLLHHLGH